MPLRFAGHSLAARKRDRAVSRLIIEIAEELDHDGGGAYLGPPTPAFGDLRVRVKSCSLQSFLQRREIGVQRRVEGDENVYVGRPQMRRCLQLRLSGENLWYEAAHHDDGQFRVS